MCLPPIVTSRAGVLILGTLPGDESLRRQQYYGHPRNDFWPLIAALAGADVPSSYARRVAMLKRLGFALWDVLLSADRPGSMDAAIRNGEANAFGEFFSCYPLIRKIAFNGRGAEALFRRYVAPSNDLLAKGIDVITLPSTSPAYVRPFEEKFVAWAAALGADQKRRAR
jgi:hypoxanthine-DNA glycosylase